MYPSCGNKVYVSNSNYIAPIQKIKLLFGFVVSSLLYENLNPVNSSV
jgi:hypothetical protein